jgi:hypothetical protein
MKKKKTQVYSFTAWGHPSIRATHHTTFMFTKDPECTARGNCIIGVGSNFDIDEFKRCSFGSKIRIVIIIEKEKGGVFLEKISGFANADFDDSREMVIRKSAVADKRTAAFSADKAAFGLTQEFRAALQKKVQIKVMIEELG